MKNPTNFIFNQTWRDKYFSESKIYMKDLLEAADVRHRCGEVYGSDRAHNLCKNPFPIRRGLPPGAGAGRNRV